MSKSRSFRDCGQKSRPIKYKKNKTTNLDKLTASMSTTSLKCSSNDEDYQGVLDKKCTMVTVNQEQRKNSGSFMQNMTTMFKNIRWLNVYSPLPVSVQIEEKNQATRLVTDRKLSNGKRLFYTMKKQNILQSLLSPSNESFAFTELIWLFCIDNWIVKY